MFFPYLEAQIRQQTQQTKWVAMVGNQDPGSSGYSKLREQLLNESAAMAQYAFAAGLKVPPKLVGLLESQIIDGQDVRHQRIFDDKSPHPDPIPLNTSSPGKCGNGIMQLAMIHEKLSRIVEPAKPRSILLLAEESDRKSLWRFLGPVPLVRQMMFAALLSTAAFILIGLSTNVRSDPVAGNVLTSFGWDLFCNELFFLAAAGVGASFAALFQVNRYIVDGTFEPKYQSSYWIRFVLGLISGLILACLVPIETSESTFMLTKPLLALLGGFSSAVVYRILTRLVTTVETLVSGETRDIIAARVQESKAQFAEQTIQHRLKIASDLLRIQQQILPGDTPEAVRNKIDGVLNDLLPLEVESISLRTDTVEK